MEEICVREAIVIRIKFIFGLLGCKTMRNCVYNETAGKQRSFISFILWDITCNLMKWWVIEGVGCVVSGSDTSCHFVFD